MGWKDSLFLPVNVIMGETLSFLSAKETRGSELTGITCEANNISTYTPPTFHLKVLIGSVCFYGGWEWAMIKHSTVLQPKCRSGTGSTGIFGKLLETHNLRSHHSPIQHAFSWFLGKISCILKLEKHCSARPLFRHFSPLGNRYSCQCSLNEKTKT